VLSAFKDVKSIINLLSLRNHWSAAEVTLANNLTPLKSDLEILSNSSSSKSAISTAQADEAVQIKKLGIDTKSQTFLASGEIFGSYDTCVCNYIINAYYMTGAANNALAGISLFGQPVQSAGLGLLENTFSPYTGKDLVTLGTKDLNHPAG